jgi:hypothetical protein
MFARSMYWFGMENGIMQVEEDMHTRMENNG